MIRKTLVLASCVLLSASTLLAQSRPAKNAKPDPITGSWVGHVIPPDFGRQISVTMELKFDGKQAVSGSVSGLPNPADVKVGTFDPKSGALKLQLGKVGDSAVLLVLEGTVVKDTASGKADATSGTGEFKLTKKP